jgi:nifR3 family TIM-barrel protein
MNQGFWGKLAKEKKPFFVLAPMDDITNLVFRKIVTRCGKPDVFFTEFVSADGVANKEGRENLLEKLKFTEKERPIVAQFFGANPDHFFEAGKLAKELGFDGIDINMGCPDRSVTSQGAGAGLVRNPKLARKIIEATKKGAGDLPVSVKTRIGWLKNEVDSWIPEILAEGVAALTIHGRTANRGYATPADWEAIKQTAELCQKNGTVVIGNGDVWGYQNGLERAEKSGVDGVMIGRAVLKNPWVFDPKAKMEEISVPDRLNLLQYHVKLFKEKYPKRNFSELKKYFAGYVSDFAGAKELRVKLMDAKSGADVKKIVEASGFIK